MNTFIRENTGSKDTERQIYTTLSQDNIIFKSTPDTPGGIRFRHKIVCSTQSFLKLFNKTRKTHHLKLYYNYEVNFYNILTYVT